MLGSRIASLRSRMGLSQAQLARMLHISPSTVGMYEQGRRVPSAEMLLILSQTLGVSVEFLLTGSAFSREDQPLLADSRAGEGSVLESLRYLSREELLVLLTAELIGSRYPDT